MTQPTKPSAGALRAARKIAERTLRTLQGWDEQTWVDVAAEIIDRETGKARKRQSRAGRVAPALARRGSRLEAGHQRRTGERGLTTA